MSARRGLARAALVALLALGPLGARAADGPPPPAKQASGPARASASEAPPPDAPEAERRLYWQTRARQARDRVAAARERLAAAEEAYQNLHTRHRTGAPLGAAVAEREAAATELEQALHYLEDQLPEEARRGGALPGWIRE